jgi:hypothetical protein
MIETKTIIIGAGPAGLMAGNMIRGDVIILEKNQKVGKKLLISGQGQCNFTHEGDIRDFFDKYGANNNFVKYGLSKFTNKDTINFFNQLGIETIIREDGKVFPKSLSAEDIVEGLLQNIKTDQRKSIHLNEKVLELMKKRGKFIVNTPKETYASRNVIIATGGRSYVSTGSSGDGYAMAKDLDITVTDIKTGLANVKIKDFRLQEAAGIALEQVTIAHYRNNSKINAFVGDLMITHKGFSGPVILNNSRLLNKGDQLKISFLNYTYQQMDDLLLKKIAMHPKKNVINVLKMFNLPENLVDAIFIDLNLTINAAHLSKDLRKQVVKRLIQYTCVIESPGSFKTAMVTVGGIALNEINKKTMESTTINNLFFIGEVLDIDGDTGGYNIQWAFSSAYLAAQQINKKGGKN